jgi:hypothetical protein
LWNENIMQLNHIFRTRDLVTKNDSKVGKHWENAKDELLSGDEFLDHGFTRPKVVWSGFHWSVCNANCMWTVFKLCRAGLQMLIRPMHPSINPYNVNITSSKNISLWHIFVYHINIPIMSISLLLKIYHFDTCLCII